MFTKEELQAIYQIMSRVQITGNEAKAVASMQLKIEQLLSQVEDKKDASEKKN